MISDDRETVSMRPDAEALLRVLEKHSTDGGPSSPLNLARFARYRDFILKRCNRDIGSSLMNPIVP
jgi:hypothetical protein